MYDKRETRMISNTDVTYLKVMIIVIGVLKLGNCKCIIKQLL